jgi:hypothetical protein
VAPCDKPLVGVANPYGFITDSTGDGMRGYVVVYKESTRYIITIACLSRCVRVCTDSYMVVQQCTTPADDKQCLLVHAARKTDFT